MSLKTAVLACVLFAVASSSAYGQIDLTADDLSDLTPQELTAVKVYSAARHEQRPFDSPRAISVVTSDEIRDRAYRTVPEALNDVVGVMVQETTYAAGSPIIRGLIGNQVLIMVDGVRMNNAIYRLGPNQYLNTIDINQVERIEVIRGPGSVLYGSDALGGVISIVTKSRQPDGKGFAGDGAARLSSADRATLGRAALSYGTSTFGVNGGASLKRFGDLRATRAVGLQPFTGYDELDADFKATAKLVNEQRIEAGLQHLDQRHVDRTDLLLSGRNLKYEWNPQRRDLAYLKYTAKPGTQVVDAVSLTASYHVQSEQYEIIGVALPTTQEVHRDRVGTTSFAAQVSSLPSKRQMFTYGAEYFQDHILSRRRDLDLRSGAWVTQPGAFADGSLYRGFATFVQDEIEMTHRLSLNLGLRASVFDLHARLKSPTVGTSVIDSEPSALTGSAYGLYRLTSRLHLTLGLAQGFRAPNINDTTVIGPFGVGFEIPNPLVRPEQTLNYEIGLKTQSTRFHGSAVYYMTRLHNGIDVAATSENSLAFLDLNGNGVKDAQEPDLFQRQNTGRAKIRGFGLDGTMRLSSAIIVTSNVGWTEGDDLTTHRPLRRIPPFEGLARIAWVPIKRLRIEYQNTFARAQNRLSPLDIKDPRIGPGGMPRFSISTVRAGLELAKKNTITFVLENLTDSLYKTYSSGFSAPGFGVVLGIQHTF